MGRLAASLLLAAGIVVAAGVPARAVIIASGNGTGNAVAPPDDPGWANLGVIGGLSAVYLGNGWVATARHVGANTTHFLAVPYSAVAGSEVQFETSPGILADLVVFKIEGEPPLPSLPIASAPPAVGADVIMAGNGRNRGAPLTWQGKQGWWWGSGKAMRWGTNRVQNASTNVTLSGTTTRAFSMDFTQSPPAQVTEHEAQFANGDSGGAVFIQTGGVWELAGINFVRATYGGQPNDSALYGNLSYAVQLAHYRDAILAVVTQPACSDGLDDDGDGLVDWPADLGCDDALDSSEWSDSLPCDDGRDNDEDGATDFPDDVGCAGPLSALENPQCQDGIDNDGDSLVDWDGGGVGSPDPQCVDRPWRNLEAGSYCGLGFELALLLPPLVALRRRRGRAPAQPAA